MTDDDAPGWDAITAAVTPLYGTQEPLHFGTVIKFCLGGPDPLDGISIYRAIDPATGRPHWHFVSYGMSELYAKESKDNEYSGWGFEFTFRLARDPADEQPPNWSLNFLQNLARYVYQSGHVFNVGDHLDLNGPIALGDPTSIRAVLIAEDPQLPPINTPNGKLQFRQIVGITPDELDAARGWSTSRFLDLLRSNGHHLLVTDLRRPSALDDPAFARAVADGTRTDGCSTGTVFSAAVSWSVPASPADPVRLQLGASAVPLFKLLLTGRIPHDRPFSLFGPDQRRVSFEPAPHFAAHAPSPTELQISLPAAAATALAATLAPNRGTYTTPAVPRLLLDIVPSPIKDHTGAVAQVIGEESQPEPTPPKAAPSFLQRALRLFRS